MVCETEGEGSCCVLGIEWRVGKREGCGREGRGVVVERGGRWARWLALHVGRSWVARFVNIVLFIDCGGMHGGTFGSFT